MLTFLLIASVAAGASSAAVKRAEVTASKAAAKGCHTRYAGRTKRTAVVRATAPATGLVRARLRSRADFDLGVFDARSKRFVAGSAALGGREVAEGFVTKGQRVIVQACHFRGHAKRARVSVTFVTSHAGPAQRTQIVEVSTPTRADKTRLQGLGLDLTESGTAKSVDVMVTGNAGLGKLRRAKFGYRVKIADLDAQARLEPEAQPRLRRAGGAGGRHRPAERSHRLPPPGRLRAGAEAAGAAATRTWCGRSRCPTAPISAVTWWASRSPGTCTT